MKRVLIAFMTISLLVPYFFVIAWQGGGTFLCNEMFIQFGDSHDPDMPHYSGRFTIPRKRFAESWSARSTYLDESGSMSLGYCDAEGAWTISKSEDGPCEYIYKSEETAVFDVVEVAFGDWLVKTENNGDVKPGWFVMSCIDCDEDVCDPEHGRCGKMGQGDNSDRCICNEGRFGINCELELACNDFALDQRTWGNQAAIPEASFFLEHEFVGLDVAERLGQHITMYDRFVYVNKDKATWNRYSAGEITTDEIPVEAFIVFTGRRWVIYSIPPSRGNIGTPPLTLTEFITFFGVENDAVNKPIETLKNVTNFLGNYSPQFFSTPVDYGEESHSFHPSTATWLLAKDMNGTVISAVPDNEQPLSAKLICTNCVSSACSRALFLGFLSFLVHYILLNSLSALLWFQNVEKCHDDGMCQPDDTCLCNQFSYGALCERAIDCVAAEGCFNDRGTCNKLTGVCESCREGK